MENKLYKINKYQFTKNINSSRMQNTKIQEIQNSTKHTKDKKIYQKNVICQKYKKTKSRKNQTTQIQRNQTPQKLQEIYQTKRHKTQNTQT